MNRQTFARQLGRIEHRHGHSTKTTREALQKLLTRIGGAYVISNGKITGYRLRDGSLVCRKRRYHDEAGAVRDLRHITAVASNRHIPVRAYSCGSCRGFHLTSSA